MTSLWIMWTPVLCVQVARYTQSNQIQFNSIQPDIQPSPMQSSVSYPKFCMSTKPCCCAVPLEILTPPPHDFSPIEIFPPFPTFLTSSHLPPLLFPSSSGCCSPRRLRQLGDTHRPHTQAHLAVANGSSSRVLQPSIRATGHAPAMLRARRDH